LEEGIEMDDDYERKKLVKMAQTIATTQETLFDPEHTI
jgi:hypothetical protein